MPDEYDYLRRQAEDDEYDPHRKLRRWLEAGLVAAAVAGLIVWWLW